MPTRPARFKANGVRAPRQVDRDRGSARERGYSTAWDKAAKGHRRHHPLCRYCEVGAWGDPPAVRAATHTDHLYPHRTYAGVFWDKTWWVSCCKPCHDGPKQALERQGRAALDALALRLGLPTLGG